MMGLDAGLEENCVHTSDFILVAVWGNSSRKLFICGSKASRKYSIKFSERMTKTDDEKYLI